MRGSGKIKVYDVNWKQKLKIEEYAKQHPIAGAVLFHVNPY